LIHLPFSDPPAEKTAVIPLYFCISASDKKFSLRGTFDDDVADAGRASPESPLRFTHPLGAPVCTPSRSHAQHSVALRLRAPTVVLGVVVFGRVLYSIPVHESSESGVLHFHLIDASDSFPISCFLALICMVVPGVRMLEKLRPNKHAIFPPASLSESLSLQSSPGFLYLILKKRNIKMYRIQCMIRMLKLACNIDVVACRVPSFSNSGCCPNCVARSFGFESTRLSRCKLERRWLPEHASRG